MTTITIVELPPASPQARARAIERLVAERAQLYGGTWQLPNLASFRRPGVLDTAIDGAGLAASQQEQEEAQRLRAILETAYLAATYDGISSEEVAVLSAIIRAISHEHLRISQMQVLFDEFAHGVAEEGRQGRVEAIASVLSNHVERDEALSFAVLIAIADGTLARKEARVLIELAEAFGHSVGELKVLIDELGRSLSALLIEAE